MIKKVFVSGCYDLLHSGHIAFFKEASQYGDLHVGIGSDATIRELKGRDTINSEQERLYMVKAVRYVKDAWINKGSGMLDFEESLTSFLPDIFIVNEDGHSPAKESLCKHLKIEYKVLKRIPEENLPARSTTSIRTEVRSRLPFRIDLAGTWIDQPYVSKFHPGWAITVSIEPTIDFNERCGMSTSTRNAAAKLWPYELPLMHPEKLAQLIFHFENEPGRKQISGAQDAIGICMPGINRHYYNNTYWPEKIETILDEDIIVWLEKHLSLILLWPRPAGTDLLKETNINADNVKALTQAASKAWEGITNKDIKTFSEAFRESFEAQVSMFPAMVPTEVKSAIDEYKDKALAWKLAGAGGGGYLVLLSEQPIKNAIKIKIRRNNGL
ncbi:adenylyltransferase/cytidyltransferase family protein [Bacteroidales bacterium OttesenSCG-928-M11]|nr:adenylyltransferase/cytidyltransferase family protein [Bacteroidales bacterium OttesenSCG-928-M11]